MESEERDPQQHSAAAADFRPSSTAGDIMRRIPQHREQPHPGTNKASANSRSRPCCGAIQGVSWEDIYHIATWAILGTILRVYIGRIFGQDCENQASGTQEDFWEASHICITSSGETSRRGGTLFIDLPANILGSFIMGLLSASKDHPIPWFPENHHLQRHASWHKGLTTGFCGCLTTCKSKVPRQDSFVFDTSSNRSTLFFISQLLHGTHKWSSCWMAHKRKMDRKLLLP